MKFEDVKQKIDDYFDNISSEEIIERFKNYGYKFVPIKNKTMIKVYISSPYSLGSVELNVRKQIDASNELMNNGIAAFVPLLYHYQEIIHTRDYDDWMNMLICWLPVCDCLLRLPGESKGADVEVAKAIELDIPVFYSIEELIKFYNKTNI